MALDGLLLNLSLLGLAKPIPGVNILLVIVVSLGNTLGKVNEGDIGGALSGKGGISPSSILCFLSLCKSHRQTEPLREEDSHQMAYD